MPFKPEVCYSHSNGNLLSEHLFYVGKAIFNMLPYHKDIGFLIGIFHDFGKLTSYYQKYIQSKINNEPLLDVNEKYKSHTALGALFCLYFFDSYLDNKRKHLLPAILNCSFHHSVLSDIESLLVISDKFSDEEIINAQLQDLLKRLHIINAEYKNELLRLINSDEDSNILKNYIHIIDEIDFSDFLRKTANIKNILRSACQVYRNDIKKSGNIETAFFTTVLFGSLVNADRELADKLPGAFFEMHNSFLYQDKIEANIIERFVTEKFGNKDKLKTLLFNTVDNTIDNENAMNHKIFNITAPTGSGKTETSLNFAFKLRDKINAQRIIYALPLTNVLEQNYDRLHKIFSEYLSDYKDANCLNYLLKYHYLANYDALINENDSLGEALKNAERLNSQVVITTYIQILYALISNSPHFLSRLPLLHNSVILFDEPQVLSPEHWLLINNGLKLLTEKFNCRVILLTATKPLIFNESECFELTKSINFIEYLKNRTVIRPVLHINDFDGLIDLLTKQFGFYSSMLVVLNTIKSSIELYTKLKDNNSFKGYKIFYLSTNLIPVHRQEIIQEVNKQLADKNKIILVSTQVIEAGVEFDFDMGVRDLSTFDSIVQIAGRINRKGEKGTSYPIYIVKLQHEKTRRYYSSYIYNDEFLRFTEDLLINNGPEIQEMEYQKLTEMYFQKILEFMQDFNEEESTGNALYKYIRCQFTEISNDFKIIEDDVDKMPVLIPFDKNIDECISKYNDILNKFKEASYEEKWELKRLLVYSRRKIIPYIINISQKSLPMLNQYLLKIDKSQLSWVYYVNKDLLDYCYVYNSKSKQGQGLTLTSESEGLWI